MSDLITTPLEDWFKTSLSQAWDWATWTIYVNATPDFTFPSWETTYIVVNPNKSNMQIAEIDAYSSWAWTMTVSNITLEKWASVNSTQQSHSVGSEVIISDNYQFWSDIKTAINSKVDQSTWQVTAYANATARDAAITSPVNWMQVYLTDTWVFTDYLWGSWTNRDNGSATANASETVAGKVELPTQTEFDNWDDTWGTWAKLSVLPSQVQALAISWVVWITWELRLWTTDLAPTNWLIANWDAVSRTTYATLFAVISDTYWVWDWSTTFNLPDLRWNTPVGKDWATFTALWDTWGTETHTLTESEMPAHTHDFNYYNWNWVSNETPYVAKNDSAWGANMKSSTNASSSSVNSTTWSWTAHNILQPYLVINYIIKT